MVVSIEVASLFDGLEVQVFAKSDFDASLILDSRLVCDETVDLLYERFADCRWQRRFTWRLVGKYLRLASCWLHLVALNNANDGVSQVLVVVTVLLLCKDGRRSPFFSYADVWRVERYGHLISLLLQVVKYLNQGRLLSLQVIVDCLCLSRN